MLATSMTFGIERGRQAWENLPPRIRLIRCFASSPASFLIVARSDFSSCSTLIESHTSLAFRSIASSRKARQVRFFQGSRAKSDPSRIRPVFFAPLVGFPPVCRRSQA